MRRVNERNANSYRMKHRDSSVPLTLVRRRQSAFSRAKRIWLLIQTSAIGLTSLQSQEQKPDLLEKPTPLYNTNSIWNKSIPPNPSLDPESDNMIQGLAQSISNHGFVMNLNEWSIPVYRAPPKKRRPHPSPWLPIGPRTQPWKVSRSLILLLPIRSTTAIW